MTLYLKDPKDSIKKLLNLINTLGNVAEYKINIQNSVAFLNTKNEQIERDQENNLIQNSLKK
jgi:hypothetical protein